MAPMPVSASAGPARSGYGPHGPVAPATDLEDQGAGAEEPWALRHPTRPLLVMVPSGWSAAMTVSGAYLRSREGGVEVAWLSPAEAARLPSLAHGSEVEGWRVEGRRATQARVPGRGAIQLVELKLLGREEILMVRADVPLAGGVVVLTSEVRPGDAGESRALVSRVAGALREPDLSAKGGWR